MSSAECLWKPPAPGHIVRQRGGYTQMCFTKEQAFLTSGLGWGRGERRGRRRGGGQRKPRMESLVP